MSKQHRTTLALYPNQHGIGFAIFDSSTELADFGIGYVQPLCNKRTLKRVRNYLSYYKPDIVITREQYEKSSKRIQRLLPLICEEARKQGYAVHQYSREQIKEVFSQFKAESKHQISKVIIGAFPILKPYGFPDRERWMSESHDAGIFDAVALGMTHYYLS